jgi:hypothetical protein
MVNVRVMLLMGEGFPAPRMLTARIDDVHHRDPFDPLLVAQAEIEGLTLLTRDPVFDRYAEVLGRRGRRRPSLTRLPAPTRTNLRG